MVQTVIVDLSLDVSVQVLASYLVLNFKFLSQYVGAWASIGPQEIVNKGQRISKIEFQFPFVILKY